MRVLIVDTFFRRPPRDGGSRAIHDLERSLIELGHETLVETSLEAFVDAVNAGITWDLVILSRPDTAVRAADIARGAAPRVVHLGHDLHHLRLDAERRETGEPSTGIVRAQLALERQSWLRCDVSLYPARSEVDIVDGLVGAGHADWFPYYRVDEAGPVVAGRRGDDLVFLGGGGHAPNVTGLRWFFEHVAPLLPASHRRVSVIGDWSMRPTPPRSSEVDIRWVGTLDDVGLRSALRDAAAMIVPLRTGAGVKSKVVDALASGVPVVSTPVGVEGLAWPEPFAWVSSDASVWPELISAATSEGDEAIERRTSGVRLVSEVYGPAAYRDALSSLLSGPSLG